MNTTNILMASLALLAAGCSQMDSKPVSRLMDGQLDLPQDYRNWPAFLVGVQREDVKQVRDIYMNDEARRAGPGRAYGDGSVFVMENWSVKLDAEGKPAKGPDGKLVKDKLAAVFVMGKNTGWGDGLPEAQRNGNWIYSAFKGNGEANGEARYDACRSCHAPLKDKDFVFRVDEYQAKLRR